MAAPAGLLVSLGCLFLLLSLLNNFEGLVDTFVHLSTFEPTRFVEMVGFCGINITVLMVFGRASLFFEDPYGLTKITYSCHDGIKAKNSIILEF